MDIELKEVDGELLVSMVAGTKPPPPDQMLWRKLKDYLALFGEVQATHEATGKAFNQNHVDAIWAKLNSAGVGKVRVQAPSEQDPKPKTLDHDAIYGRWNGGRK